MGELWSKNKVTLVSTTCVVWIVWQSIVWHCDLSRSIFIIISLYTKWSLKFRLWTRLTHIKKWSISRFLIKNNCWHQYFKGYADTKSWAHENELCSSIIRQSPISEFVLSKYFSRRRNKAWMNLKLQNLELFSDNRTEGFIAIF